MEPRIQYAQTKDGASIAFWTIGEGAPLVHMPGFRMSHIQQELLIPEYRRWYEELSEGRQLVRYDGRGIGLSQRDVADYSLDALVADVEAVVDRLGLERFALFGILHNGPVAIAYAAKHPQRVSKLILWCSYARSSDYAQSSQIQTTRGMIGSDWELYTETLASVRFGWSEGEPARKFAALMRESITSQALQALIDAYRELDVSALLTRITQPTLILHRPAISWLSLDVARELAANIPDSLLVLLDGTSGAPYLGDWAAAVAAIDGFLRDRPAVARRRQAGAVRTILFTDIEASTALTERLGDAKARELLREHERMIREELRRYGGSEVKTLGDGFMTSFSSAARALECAIAMQRAFAARNQLADERILMRVGVNAGEPIAEEEDLFGTAVIEAARITAAAKGGEILVANVVRELTKGKDFLFADRGELEAKGFEDPVRLFEVRWREG